MHYYMNKLGFVNFWDFEKEEIYFNKGNALIRGENGSGKSIVLQSAIVYLLDGNMRASRLDPSGTTARQMSYYLLGNDENITESTGYLYLEFYHPDKKHYITIGTGLRARRNAGIDFWGFVLRDGRRIEKDVKLYTEEGDYNIALDKKSCRQIMKQDPCNIFTERQQDYERSVNEALFGMSRKKYKELLNFLIEIRKPIAGADSRKGLKFIYEKLNNSLPVMKEEDLNALTVSIRSMDELSKIIETRKIEQKAILSLKEKLDSYNAAILYEKKQKLDLLESEGDKLKEEVLLKKDQKRSEEQHLKEIEEKLLAARKNMEEANAKLYALKNDGNYEEFQRLHEEINRLEDKIKHQKESIEKEEDNRIDIEQKIKEQDDHNYAREKEIKEFWEQSDETAWELDLPFHNEYADINENYDLAESFMEQARTYKRRILECLERIKEKEKQERQLESGKGLIIQTQKMIDQCRKRIDRREESLKDERRIYFREMSEYASLCQIYDMRSHLHRILELGEKERWKDVDDVLFYIFMDGNNHYVDRNGYVKAGSKDLREIEKNEEKLNILKQEYKNIPSYEKLIFAKQEIALIETEWKKENEFLDRLEEGQEELKNDYRKIHKEIQSKINEYGFLYPLKSEKYESLNHSLEEYIQSMTQVLKAASGLKNGELLKHSFEERLAETEELISDLRYECRELENDKEVITSRLKALDVKVDYEEAITLTKQSDAYRDEIAACLAEKHILEEKTIPKLIANIFEFEKKLAEQELIYTKSKEDMDRAMKRMHVDEIRLVMNPQEKAEKLIHEFRDHESLLLKYRPRLLRDENSNHLELTFLETESVEEIYEKVSAEVKEKDHLLEEQETNLYQKVLLDTASQKMVYKIKQSREWVDNISERMKELKTTSGMVFHIMWNPKKAEELEEMSTENLEQLLTKSIKGNITEEDLMLIKKHFSSKLMQEKEKALEEGMEADYEEMIRNCFDYRNWYEFKMFISEPRQKEKELSNKRFMSLSGGERATAIYSSLLSALNSLYSECEKEDHPRFMGLDEAFTVCDSSNTDAVFAFIEQMDLEYLLNSQTLWGTYPSVKNLAISHLTHDKKSGTVAVSRFSWNGKERRPVFSQ